MMVSCKVFTSPSASWFSSYSLVERVSTSTADRSPLYCGAGKGHSLDEIPALDSGVFELSESIRGYELCVVKAGAIWLCHYLYATHHKKPRPASEPMLKRHCLLCAWNSQAQCLLNMQYWVTACMHTEYSHTANTITFPLCRSNAPHNRQHSFLNESK